MHSQQGFAEVNGTRLFYELAGEGDPLVFVHGNTLDVRMWDDQFAYFAERYRVLRYDLRGYGRSASPPDQPYSHSDDLMALLTRFGMAPATLVGLSLGGGVVIDFALIHPEATRALVPVDSSVSGWGFSAAFQSAMARVIAAARDQGIDAAKGVWLQDALFAPANEQPAVAARLAAMVREYDGWRWLNDDPRRVAQPPAVEQLHRITAPTLIVVGARDIGDAHGIADLLEREIAGARKVVLEGVGHMANMEAPERFNEVLAAFLSSH